MAPHDDLTAERAAIIGKHYECEDPWYSCPMSDEGCVNPGEGEECTCGVDIRRILLDTLLKTARQEALREAVTKIRQRGDEYMRDCEAKDAAGKKYRDTYEMRRVNSGRAWAFKDLADELDRLASEGG